VEWEYIIITINDLAKLDDFSIIILKRNNDVKGKVCQTQLFISNL